MLHADDIARLYIDDALVSESAGGKDMNTVINRKEGDQAFFVLEYGDRSFTASCKLRWSINERDFTDIPLNQLNPAEYLDRFKGGEIRGYLPCTQTPVPNL